MKFISASDPAALEGPATPILLFGQSSSEHAASAGSSIANTIRRRKLRPAPAAWDLLAIALSVVVADGAQRRSTSPDGWTREFELNVALRDPDPWQDAIEDIESALAFLTTDRWKIFLRNGGFEPDLVKDPQYPSVDAVALLSGGLDSLVGAIDLTAQGHKLFAVSQTVRGDANKQERFARIIGGGLEHLQLNHNASTRRGVKETSQRSRSLIFLAFAVLAATATESYRQGATVPIYVSENGFIAVNPPLTTIRIGSLSTRTAHPYFLSRMEALLQEVGLRVTINNPYAERTKGEMLLQGLDQGLLIAEAPLSTSCGRFQRFKYMHCGRCLPCQIRRSSFLAWGQPDSTDYVYGDLGQNDADHAGFDDVRSVAMARLVADRGFDEWLGPTLSSTPVASRASLRAMLRRGLDELVALHRMYDLE